MNIVLKPYIVAVDWGTSSFRARLVDKEGRVISDISTNEGILKSKGQFELVLQKSLQSLSHYHIGIPIVMSGMIGSKNGWFEAKYTDLPCSIHTLATNISIIPSSLGEILLIPGVCKQGKDADVIRGEETEVMGAIRLLGLENANLIIPGTHSKVVSIQNGIFNDFKTFLTGEMFFALCESTILGAFGRDVDCQSEAFTIGVKQGFDSTHSGELLHHVFLARSRVLLSDLDEKDSASFLSGVLIGAEIGASAYQQNDIWIMGNGKLPLAYQTALQSLNFNAQIVPDNTVVLGSLAIFDSYKEKGNA